MKRTVLSLILSSLLVGCGGSDKQASSISEPKNKAPVIKSIPNFKLTPNMAITHKVIASDENKNDRLSYKLKTESSFISIDQNGIVTLAPSIEDEGGHEFAVIVSDGTIDVLSNTVIMDVVLATMPCSDGSCLEDDGFTNPNLPMIPTDPDLVNHAPVINQIPDMQLETTKNITYQVIASDKNKDDVLSYQLNTDAEFVTIDNDGILTFSPRAEDEGIHEFSVIVSDGVFHVESNKINVKVILATGECSDGSCLEDDGFTNPNLPMIPTDPDLVNHAPVIETISDIQLTHDSSMQYKVMASDKNASDILSYKVISDASFIHIDQDGVLHFNPTISDVGTHSFKVMVSDDQFDIASNLVTVSVILSTGSCEDGACLEDDFINPSEPIDRPTGTNIDKFIALTGIEEERAKQICETAFIQCGYVDNKPYFSYQRDYPSNREQVQLFPLSGGIKFWAYIGSIWPEGPVGPVGPNVIGISGPSGPSGPIVPINIDTYNTYSDGSLYTMNNITLHAKGNRDMFYADIQLSHSDLSNNNYDDTFIEVYDDMYSLFSLKKEYSSLYQVQLIMQEFAPSWAID